jgi:hypothetical protein
VHQRGDHAKDTSSAVQYKVQCIRARVDELRTQKLSLNRSSASFAEEAERLAASSEKVRGRRTGRVCVEVCTCVHTCVRV